MLQRIWLSSLVPATRWVEVANALASWIPPVQGNDELTVSFPVRAGAAAQAIGEIPAHAAGRQGPVKDWITRQKRCQPHGFGDAMCQPARLLFPAFWELEAVRRPAAPPPRGTGRGRAALAKGNSYSRRGPSNNRRATDAGLDRAEFVWSIGSVGVFAVRDDVSADVRSIDDRS
jgi:hypothetical protein